jgi:hypothetical protein
MTLSAILTIGEMQHGGILQMMIGGISRSIVEADKGAKGQVEKRSIHSDGIISICQPILSSILSIVFGRLNCSLFYAV